MRIIGFCVCVLGVLMAGLTAADWITGDLTILVGWPELFYYVTIIAGVLLLTRSYKTFVAGVNAVLSRSYSITDERRGEAISLFELLVKTVKCACALMLVVSLMMVLLRFDDPSMLGPTIAAAFRSVLYAAFIIMVLLNPLQYILRGQPADEPARVAKITEKAAVEKLLRLCFEQGLTHTDIMEAEGISLQRKNIDFDR